MTSIQNKDITFVLQGPIYQENGINLTQKTCQKIRDIFPDSKIIISTWKNQQIQDMDCDRVLENNDPGPVTNNQDLQNNINRMIVSTVNGLKKVETKYAVRMRTDCYLESDLFIALYASYLAQYDGDAQCLSQPVLTNFRIGKMYYGYNLSDWFSFGKTQDVLNLWDVPHVSKQDGEYFDEIYKPKLFQNLFLGEFRTRFRLCNEQHVYCSFLEKNSMDCDFPDSRVYLTFSDYGKHLAKMSNMFFFASAKMLDLHSFKYPQYIKYTDHDAFKIWQTCYAYFKSSNPIYILFSVYYNRIRYCFVDRIRLYTPRIIMSSLRKIKHRYFL